MTKASCKDVGTEECLELCHAFSESFPIHIRSNGAFIRRICHFNQNLFRLCTSACIFRLISTSVGASTTKQPNSLEVARPRNANHKRSLGRSPCIECVILRKPFASALCQCTIQSYGIAPSWTFKFKWFSLAVPLAFQIRDCAERNLYLLDPDYLLYRDGPPRIQRRCASSPMVQ